MTKNVNKQVYYIVKHTSSKLDIPEKSKGFAPSGAPGTGGTTPCPDGASPADDPDLDGLFSLEPAFSSIQCSTSSSCHCFLIFTN